jgi:hypothetical protein
MRSWLVTPGLILLGCGGTKAKPRTVDPATLARAYFEALSQGQFDRVAKYYVPVNEEDSSKAKKIAFEIERARRKHYLAVRGSSVEHVRVFRGGEEGVPEGAMAAVVIFRKKGVPYYLPIMMESVGDGGYWVCDVDSARQVSDEMMAEWVSNPTDGSAAAGGSEGRKEQ